MRHPGLLSLVFTLFVFPAVAKDLGTVAEVFPVKEESLIAFLRKNLSDGAFARKREAIKAMISEKAKHPAPIPGILLATEYRAFYLDPTLHIEENIEDGIGNVICKAGTTYNPLEQIQLRSGLLFFDGARETHVEWAREQQGSFKWILVKGGPIELEAQEKRVVYFDQGGTYTTRFHIQKIPARVTQQGFRFLIEEIPLKESEATP